MAVRLLSPTGFVDLPIKQTPSAEELKKIGFQEGEEVWFISISGGKDSLVLLDKVLTEYTKETSDREVFIVPTFGDTGWEHPLTYETLERIADYYRIGILRLVGYTMEELIQKYKKFPTKVKRFCTRELKVRPKRRLLTTLQKLNPSKVVIWLGKRRDESKARADTQEIVVYPPRTKTPFDRKFSFLIEERNPLVYTTEGEIWEIIRKKGLPYNPLYDRGHRRVGCYPCFISQRNFYLLIEEASKGDKYAQQMIEKLRTLEREVGGKTFLSMTIDNLIHKHLVRKLRERKQLELF